jgi:hypothetical protein
MNYGVMENQSTPKSIFFPHSRRRIKAADP